MRVFSLLAALCLATPAFAAPAAAAAAVDVSGLEKRAPVSVTYDDKLDPTSNVVYPDGWTHLTNQGFGTYQKTLSYTGRQGEVFVYLPGSSRVRARSAVPHFRTTVSSITADEDTAADPQPG